jgi:hypothetical protein
MERSKYAEATEQNKLRTEAEREKYLLRQQISEHPFGIIKRQWGYDHVLMKGKEKNQGEFGLIYTAYNLRRVLTIMGVNELIKRLKGALLMLFLLRRFIITNRIKNIFLVYSPPQMLLLN